MGLNASVMCRCWADGKVAPPASLGMPVIDEEGYLDVDLPSEGNEAKHEASDLWMATACEHPNMAAGDERIANWAGVRAFQELLAHLGEDHFPVLLREIPDANGGTTDLASAQAMLQELDRLSRVDDLGEVTCLLDTDAGEVLHTAIECYGGMFFRGADDIDLGVDEHGFFIRRHTAGGVKEEFRSWRFEQILQGR